MRLLETRSHTSERLGYDARNNAKKSTLTKNAGAMKRQTTVKNPPTDRQRGGGGRDGESD